MEVQVQFVGAAFGDEDHPLNSPSRFYYLGLGDCANSLGIFGLGLGDSANSRGVFRWSS